MLCIDFHLTYEINPKACKYILAVAFILIFAYGHTKIKCSLVSPELQALSPQQQSMEIKLEFESTKKIVTQGVNPYTADNGPW